MSLYRTTVCCLKAPKFARISLRHLSTVDPAYPQIHLHQIAPTRFAASLLPTPPPFIESPTILGFVNAAANDESPKISVNKFEENPEFVELLHQVISDSAFTDRVMETLAVNRGEGFLHIIDNRNPPYSNRAGEPEDILASVLVQDSKLVPGSYEPTGTYRILTSNGFPQFGSLMDSVMRGLNVARSIEKDMIKDRQQGQQSDQPQ